MFFKNSIFGEKIEIFIKNGILRCAFYENYEPPLTSRAAKKMWRAALWPCLFYTIGLCKCGPAFLQISYTKLTT